MENRTGELGEHAEGSPPGGGLENGSDVLQPRRKTGTTGTAVHPTAIVEDGARLGAGCKIGPGAVIGPEVELGERVEVGAHAVLTGRTQIGDETRIWPCAVIGEEPQDRGYDGSPTRVRIGRRCQIREHVTIHRATGEGTETVVADDVMLMATSHVAHNCRVGAEAILANGALLAGHVEIGPRAFLSGNAVVHQFVRIGRLVMVSGLSGVGKDIPPFALAAGRPAHIGGMNRVGLQRAGYTAEERTELAELYRLVKRASPAIAQAVPELRGRARTAPGRELVEFLASDSRRGFCRF